MAVTLPRHRQQGNVQNNTKFDRGSRFLQHAAPYLRAINDPFGSLVGETVEDRQVRRVVQLRVREFTKAEHLDLTVVEPVAE